MKVDKQQLITSFQELFAIEQKARDYYSDLLKNNLPEKDRLVITGIRDDEIRHMEIVKDIINIIEKDNGDN